MRAGISTWNSIAASIVMADTDGNIAYALLTTSPIRANEYPHLGMNVLDGTTTKHDWMGICKMTDLPFVINPKKGYFTTANNRIVPENSKFDIGASLPATARAQRLEELI